MGNLFHGFRRAVEVAELGIVETPVELESDEQPTIAEDRPAAGNWLQTHRDEELKYLRRLSAAKDRIIADLEDRLDYATRAAAALPAPPAFYIQPADELAAVRADRDRVERVNDGLRTRLEVKRVQLDDFREQLRRARLVLAARTGTPADELLVPWEERGPIGDSGIPGGRADTGHVAAHPGQTADQQKRDSRFTNAQVESSELARPGGCLPT